MARTVDIGVADHEVSPGDHICALYSGAAERMAIMRPYIRRALGGGDKCICLLDTPDLTQMLSTLREGEDLDLQTYSASGQLELVRASDTTLRSGRFSPAEMISFWKTAIAGAMNAGRYQRVRTIGETSSSLRDVPESRDVLRFESDLNRMLPLFPQVVLCMYDLERVGGAFLLDIVSTHSKVLVNGMVVDNPYYMSPDERLERMDD